MKKQKVTFLEINDRVHNKGSRRTEKLKIRY